MKVVIAMNAFKGNLTSSQACSLVASGFSRGFPEGEISLKPLADGGDGTIDVLVQALGGKVESVEVTGPWGERTMAQVGILEDGTAVIESAQCCGLALLTGKNPDPFSATSRGVGEAMRWAADRGAKRIIVGIGGTATNDGGIGMAQGAGAKVLDASGQDVCPGICGLNQVSRVELGDIPEIFSDVEIIGISDVKNVLVGEEGATYTYGPQKGLKPQELAGVDRAMDRYGRILGRDLGSDPRYVPMGGAGGGLGAALWSFFQACLLDGATFVMEQTGFFSDAEGADLIITGEGKLDAQTAKGKAPYAVGKAGFRRGIPVVVLGGSIDDSILPQYPPEFSAVFASILSPCDVETAMSKSEVSLPFVAEQIGRFWRTAALSKPHGTEFSAGGVVIRTFQERLQVLLIKDRFGFYALPKGHIDPGETSEEAALREVREETGLSCKIVSSGISHRYRFFSDDGKPLEKIVTYYLMEPVSGTIKPQPGEVKEILWVDETHIQNLNVYPSLIYLIEEALEIYKNE